jgi:hypothetical protein
MAGGGGASVGGAGGATGGRSGVIGSGGIEDRDRIGIPGKGE